MMYEKVPRLLAWCLFIIHTDCNLPMYMCAVILMENSHRKTELKKKKKQDNSGDKMFQMKKRKLAHKILS